MAGTPALPLPTPAPLEEEASGRGGTPTLSTGSCPGTISLPHPCHWGHSRGTLVTPVTIQSSPTSLSRPDGPLPPGLRVQLSPPRYRHRFVMLPNSPYLTGGDCCCRVQQKKGLQQGLVRNTAEAKGLSTIPVCTVKMVELCPTPNSLPAALSLVQEAGGWGVTSTPKLPTGHWTPAQQGPGGLLWPFPTHRPGLEEGHRQMEIYQFKINGGLLF